MTSAGLELIGDEYGNVRVHFSKYALQTFIIMLNNANINVEGDYLTFTVDEYAPGSAQLLVAVTTVPNTEAQVTISPVVTNIEEEG